MKKLRSNDACWCGSGRKYKRCHKMEDDIRSIGRVLPGRQSPMRTVPDSIPRPPYMANKGGRPSERPARFEQPTGDDLVAMRRSCKAAAEILAELGAMVAPGVTTDEIDARCHQLCIDAGGYPSPLGYSGYPKSVCTSVNEVICHGIPDDRELEEGDIVDIDVTIYLGGFHGDTNATFAVGEIDTASRTLMRVTRECMEKGIGAVRPGGVVRDVGQAIQDHAFSHGMSVVRAFVGHGIGRHFHGPPIFHYPEPAATMEFEEGQTFTIEPMIALGTGEHLLWDDGWTAVTADHKRTAQYEHTLRVTADGVEVLTVR